MATEEVNKPSSLPSPSELILSAIEALGDKNGSNKSAIGRQIESTHGAGTLPDPKLTETLEQMKENGELIFAKNNYLRADGVTPVKRGRGRPPKPKSATSATPTAVSSGPTRPRGRPPKDPLAVKATPPKAAPKAKASGGSGKGRGRPPKNKKATAAAEKAADKDDDDVEDAPEDEPEAAMTTTTTVVTGTGTPRGRGRPPKVKAQVAAVGV